MITLLFQKVKKMKITQLGANKMTIQLTNATVFFSYNTPVAAFVEGSGFIRAKERYSVTTTKHINAWLRQETSSMLTPCVAFAVPQQEIAALLTKGGAANPETEKATDVMRQYFPTAMNGGAAARKLCPQCGGNGCFTCSRRSLEAYNHPIMREPSDCEWEEPR